MKKSTFIILSIVSLISASLHLTSCEIESAGTGGLYANWQLRQIDTLSTGNTADMTESTIYWAFQSDVLQLRHISNGNQTIYLRFDHKHDSLIVSNPILVETKDEMKEVTSEALLLPFGITNLTDTFSIEQLNGSILCISNRLYRLRFRKY